jgi:hypothetical protein
MKQKYGKKFKNQNNILLNYNQTNYMLYNIILKSVFTEECSNISNKSKMNNVGI